MGAGIRPEGEDGDNAYWRVAIVEDHLLQRKRTEDLINREDGLQVVASCETLPQFLQWLRYSTVRTRPHLLILDLLVERQASVDPESVRGLIKDGMRVLVLSAMASPPLVRDMIRVDVGGIVGKRDSEEDIIAAIWAVLRREPWMTAELAGVMAGDSQRPTLSIQEERSLVLYASGLKLDEVAAQLGVSPNTARRYLARVKAKYAAVGRRVRTKLDLNDVARSDGFLM